MSALGTEDDLKFGELSRQILTDTDGRLKLNYPLLTFTRRTTQSAQNVNAVSTLVLNLFVLGLSDEFLEIFEMKLLLH
jgi:hypothetical protein